LHALCALRDPHGTRVRAVYVDHALQPASLAWAEHCRRTCEALHVACAVERIDVQRQGEESIEAAARRLRYERLAAHVQTDEVLLTAHHEDDQAETLLLALLRGAGTHGLAAMPALVDVGNGRHARPLLGFSRDAIATYAEAEGLSWVEDQSNADTRLSRNFLRAQVLPLLQSRWPAVVRALVRAAENSADSAVLLDAMAHADLASCRAPDQARIELTPLRLLSPPRQRNLLRYWTRVNGFQAPSAQHLDAILAQIDNPSRSGHACVDWPGVQVQRYRDYLGISARTARPDSRLALAWQPPQVLELRDAGWRLRAEAVRGQGLSQARLAGVALAVRLRQGGEVCQLVGREHRHKLKKLLQQASVPPWERTRLPLVYAGDELAAIGDRWVCAPFAATADELGWRIVLEKLTVP